MKPWLQLLRISNLPTVWSNVMVGVITGVVASNATRGARLNGWRIPEAPETFAGQLNDALPLMLAMSCLYLGGMALNDVLDVEHDRADAPHRPIVAGRVSRRAAALVAALLLVAGIAIVASLERLVPLLTTLALVVCIVLYNLWHHRSPVSRHLMGLCRGLIVVTASAAVVRVNDGKWLEMTLPPAIMLVVYTNALTWLAAREADPEVGPARRRRVLGMLAAMPLLDAVWLFLFGAWPAVGFCVGCAVLTRYWHRFVSGT